MNKKTKLVVVVLAILVVLGILIGSYFFSLKNAKNDGANSASSNNVEEQSQLVDANVAPDGGDNVSSDDRGSRNAVQKKEAVKSIVEKGPKPNEAIIEGKLRSLNEKQIFVELTDGSGVAINVSLKTPVRLEGSSKVEDVTFLKAEMQLSVKVDQNNNDASEILIKK